MGCRIAVIQTQWQSGEGDCHTVGLVATALVAPVVLAAPVPAALVAVAPRAVVALVLPAPVSFRPWFHLTTFQDSGFWPLT